MGKVRWGVLSTASIGRVVIEATRQARHAEFVAVASRDAARARAFADELGVPGSFGSYERLLASDDDNARLAVLDARAYSDQLARAAGSYPSAGCWPRSWPAAAWRRCRWRSDTRNPDRGPLLIVSGERDHTVPWTVANASYQQQRGNPGVTEIVEAKGRGHALTIDSGWREVADTALAFVKRFA